MLLLYDALLVKAALPERSHFLYHTPYISINVDRSMKSNWMLSQPQHIAVDQFSVYQLVGEGFVHDP